MFYVLIVKKFVACCASEGTKNGRKFSSLGNEGYIILVEMLSLTCQLSRIFQRAISSSLDVEEKCDIAINLKGYLGDYQCNSPLKLSKRLQKDPKNIAQLIVAHVIDERAVISKLDVGEAGFINIWINRRAIEKDLCLMYCDERLGVPLPEKAMTIVCDFSSPNIAKEMHVGHLRSTIIGDCLSNFFEFLGHRVIRVNHIGDWGTQFGLLIAFIKKYHREKIHCMDHVQLFDVMHWYQQAKKEFDAHPLFKEMAQSEVVALQNGCDRESMMLWKAICRLSRRAYQKIYGILGVHLEERGESFYNRFLPEIIKDLSQKNLLLEDQGAKCVFLDGFLNKEGKMLPLIVQKRDGGYNYATTELAALKYRVECDKADWIIVVADVGQSSHLQMVYQVSVKAGYIDPQKTRFDHVSFGLVLSEKGTKFRSREGDAQSLLELLQEAIVRAKEAFAQRGNSCSQREAEILGIGSLKYQELSCYRLKDYEFSFDKMLQFDGNTAAFILYALVRIRSLLCKAKSENQGASRKGPVLQLREAEEVSLALHIRRFFESLESMEKGLQPNRLTDYLYQLASKFHLFFQRCRVCHSELASSRLILCELTERVIEQGLKILGIHSLQKM